jgi:hypothetical protein
MVIKYVAGLTKGKAGKKKVLGSVIGCIFLPRKITDASVFT